jgi:hypothetical protein
MWSANGWKKYLWGSLGCTNIVKCTLLSLFRSVIHVTRNVTGLNTNLTQAMNLALEIHSNTKSCSFVFRGNQREEQKVCTCKSVEYHWKS